MSATKEMFIIMQENDFNALDAKTRALFTHVEVREANEWLNNQNDEIYRKLYKAKKNASKELSEYLFNKRNNLKK